MIYDHYSTPHHSEYAWDLVDWDFPLPNDLVALYELHKDEIIRYYNYVQNAIKSGLTIADLGSLQYWCWDNVIVVSHFNRVYTSFDADVYEEFKMYSFAGDMVRKERMFKAMTDDEQMEYFQTIEQINEMVAEELEEGNMQELIDEAMRSVSKREQEIKELNELFNEQS